MCMCICAAADVQKVAPEPAAAQVRPCACAICACACHTHLGQQLHEFLDTRVVIACLAFRGIPLQQAPADPLDPRLRPLNHLHAWPHGRMDAYGCICIHTHVWARGCVCIRMQACRPTHSTDGHALNGLLLDLPRLRCLRCLLCVLAYLLTKTTCSSNCLAVAAAAAATPSGPVRLNRGCAAVCARTACTNSSGSLYGAGNVAILT